MKRKNARHSKHLDGMVSRRLFCLVLVMLLGSLSALFSVLTMNTVTAITCPPTLRVAPEPAHYHPSRMNELQSTHCFDRSTEFGPSSTDPGSKNEFANLFFQWKSGRSVHKWVQYFDVYNRHLKHLKARKDVIRILEIGSGDGGSLELWTKFFGGPSRVSLTGVDLKNSSLQFANGHTRMIVGNQGDEEFLSKTLPQALSGEKFDVVMDDGSHVSAHQIATFRHSLDLLLPDGIYICEDTATSYWPKGGFGGSIESHDSYIAALVKRLLDVVHAHNVRDEAWLNYVTTHLVPLSFVLRPRGYEPSETEILAEQRWWAKLRSRIDNVHVYDQIVVVEMRLNTGGFAVRMPENITTEIKSFFW